MAEPDRFVPAVNQEAKQVYWHRGRAFETPCGVCRSLLAEQQGAKDRLAQARRWQMRLLLERIGKAARPRGKTNLLKWRAVRRDGMAAMRELKAMLERS
jgi:hypothetical protein